MTSCKEVSDLLSTSLDTRLPVSRRIGLRFHLLLCKMCSRYQQQLKFLHRAATMYTERAPRPGDAGVVLTADAAQRLTQKIRESR